MPRQQQIIKPIDKPYKEIVEAVAKFSQKTVNIVSREQSKHKGKPKQLKK